MLRCIFLKLSLILLFVSFPLASSGVESYDEYQLKAAITYNIAKFVKWPEEAFASDRAPLVICVLGDEKSTSGFASLEGRMLGQRPVRVEYLNELRDFHAGQIIYISRSSGNFSADQLAALRKQPVLTVSDIKNFTSMGGMINLVNLGGNIRFAINLDAAATAGLHLSSKLYSLATEVIRNGD